MCVRHMVLYNQWQRNKANLLSIKDSMVYLPLDKYFLKKGAMVSWSISGPHKATWGQQRTTHSGFLIPLKCAEWARSLYTIHTNAEGYRQNKIEFWTSLQAKRPFLRSTLWSFKFYINTGTNFCLRNEMFTYVFISFFIWHFCISVTDP